MKGKVLFVDDNQKILHSLKRQFFRERFDSIYLEDIKDAYDLIKSEDIDIVISDLKMAPINGVKFLTEVRKINPNIFRIMLSAHVNDDDVIDILKKNIASEIFTKPWKKQEIKDKVENFLRFKNKFDSDVFKEISEQCNTSIVRPEICKNITDAINTSKSEKFILHLLEPHPILVSRILHIANSAYFSRGKYYNLKTAINIIGLANLEAIVLSESLKSLYSDSADFLLIKKYLDREFFISQCVKKYFYKKSGEDLPKFYNLVPLFLNIGKIIMNFIEDSEESLIKKMNILSDKSFAEKEKELKSKINHVDLGVLFIYKWNLPPEYSEIVHNHHNFEELNLFHQKIVDCYFFFNELIVAIENNENIEKFKRNWFSEEDIELLKEGLGKIL